jgi:hypothetical protein
MIEHSRRDMNKCRNIGPQGLQIGLPNLMVSFFLALGPIEGHKSSAFISTWGRLNLFILFLFQP